MIGIDSHIRSLNPRSMTDCGIMGTNASHAWRSPHLYASQPLSWFHGLQIVLYSGSTHGSDGPMHLVVSMLMRAAWQSSALYSPSCDTTDVTSTILTFLTLISPLCALMALGKPSLGPGHLAGVAAEGSLRTSGVASSCGGGLLGGLRRLTGSVSAGESGTRGMVCNCKGGTTGLLPMEESCPGVLPSLGSGVAGLLALGSCLPFSPW